VARFPATVEWTLFVCRVCGAYDFAREEIWHRSNRCPGRTHCGVLVDEVTVVPKAERPATPPPALWAD
jgi:hypothetical protein